jgi:predicted esterase
MHMSGWFDLYDWPIKVGAKDDPDGLAAGVETVEQHVKALNDMGIPSDKIVVAGFSQGGAVALLTAYQSKTRYAGCVSCRKKPRIHLCIGDTGLMMTKFYLINSHMEFQSSENKA